MRYVWILLAVLFILYLAFIGIFNYNRVGMGWVAYDENDYETAYTIWKPMADNGDADAQYAIGELYFWGSGVPQDFRRAGEWYYQSAKQGNSDAQYSLGVLYADGKGVKQNFESAFYWYQLSAEQGNADSLYNMGMIHINSNLMLHNPSSNNLQSNMAMLLGLGVPRDIITAHMWFNLAASKGHEESQQMRNEISQFMTDSQLSQAQRLAEQCLAWRYQNCELLLN